MKVLFASSEAFPFITTGELGDAAGMLPAALRRRNADVRLMLPVYGDMKQEWRERLKYITNFTVPVSWRNQYCGLFEIVHEGCVCYFIDNEYYFKRQGLYGFYDDGERFAFFSRAIMEAVLHLDFHPEIIHCNDWQTALAPVYLNLRYRDRDKLERTKTVFTIHNIRYQGKYGPEILEGTVGLGREDFHVIEFDGLVNYVKGAIELSDVITTISPTHAEEITDPWYGCGLYDFLRKKKYKLVGILNGIDADKYNPATDADIAARYDAGSFETGKARCKRDLRGMFDLSDNDDPLIGMVTHFDSDEGLDLLLHMADEIAQEGIQLIIAGFGEGAYGKFFEELAARRRGQFAIRTNLARDMISKVFAGSDMLLAPSKFEPCGQRQMMALRYGSIPIVRETGGLKDTVKELPGGLGNGFTFSFYSADDMKNACLRAKSAYKNRKGWNALVRHAMGCVYDWNRPAQDYLSLYGRVLKLW